MFPVIYSLEMGWKGCLSQGVPSCSDATPVRVRFQSMRCDVWMATCRVTVAPTYYQTLFASV